MDKVCIIKKLLKNILIVAFVAFIISLALGCKQPEDETSKEQSKVSDSGIVEGGGAIQKLKLLQIIQQ